MAGRHKKQYVPIYRNLEVEFQDASPIVIKNLLICCPICHGTQISTNGTQASATKRKEGFQCHNPACEFLNDHNQGKQFTLYSSLFLKQVIENYLNIILTKMFHSRITQSELARTYGISPSLISYLYQKLRKAIDRIQGMQNLVLQIQLDWAISMDETFVTINGETYYIIMATGYTSHKILGLCVSKTRKATDIYTVFQEAEQNTVGPIKVITADAWGATQSMVKNLDRPMTLVIHKHSRPFDKIVIHKYEYTQKERIKTIIGVKTDFCKRRKKRLYHYLISHEPRYPPPKKKRGRKKGSKIKRKRNEKRSPKQRKSADGRICLRCLKKGHEDTLK